MNEKLSFVDASNAADLRKVENLARQIWPETYRGIISTEQISFMLDMMYSPERLRQDVAEGVVYRLLLANGLAVGFAAFGPYAPGTLKLHKLYLSPKMHRSGLGKFMMDQVVDYANRNGYKRICLNVNRRNQAVSFYRRYGYLVQEETVLDIGNGFVMDDYIMVLELSPE